MNEKDRIAIAVLEEKVRGIDVGLLRLEARMEAGFAEVKADMADMRASMNSGMGGVKGELQAVRDSISTAIIWALGLYIALAGSMFAVMARGFQWI